jgi:hypothetical protein
MALATINRAADTFVISMVRARHAPWRVRMEGLLAANGGSKAA